MKLPFRIHNSYFILHTFFLLLLAPVALRAQDQTVQQLYSLGQVAYMRGDLDTARQKFIEVLVKDPQHTGANLYLKRLDAAKKPEDNVIKLYESLILPEITVKEATLGSVLELVRKESEKASKGTIVPNFVIAPPTEENSKKIVTLNLTKVPLSEVLRYLGTLTGLTFKIEAHAIVVGPPETINP